jgi:hypothetical protein
MILVFELSAISDPQSMLVQVVVVAWSLYNPIPTVCVTAPVAGMDCWDVSKPEVVTASAIVMKSKAAVAMRIFVFGVPICRIE